MLPASKAFNKSRPRHLMSLALPVWPGKRRCWRGRRPPSRRRISELAAEFLSAEYQPKKNRIAESAAEFLAP